MQRDVKENSLSVLHVSGIMKRPWSLFSKHFGMKV